MEGLEPLDRGLLEDDGSASLAQIEAAGDEPEAAVTLDGFSADAPAFAEVVDFVYGALHIFGGEPGGFGDGLGEGGEIASERVAGHDVGRFDVGAVGGDAEDDPVLGVDEIRIDLRRELVDAVEVSYERWFGGEPELTRESRDAGGPGFAQRGHDRVYAIGSDLVCFETVPDLVDGLHRPSEVRAPVDLVVGAPLP